MENGNRSKSSVLRRCFYYFLSVIEFLVIVSGIIGIIASLIIFMSVLAETMNYGEWYDPHGLGAGFLSLAAIIFLLGAVFLRFGPSFFYKIKRKASGKEVKRMPETLPVFISVSILILFTIFNFFPYFLNWEFGFQKTNFYSFAIVALLFILLSPIFLGSEYSLLKPVKNFLKRRKKEK